MVEGLFGQYGGYITLTLTAMGSTFAFTHRFFVKPLEKRIEDLEKEIEEERNFRLSVQSRLLGLKTFADDKRPE